MGVKTKPADPAPATQPAKISASQLRAVWDLSDQTGLLASSVAGLENVVSDLCDKIQELTGILESTKTKAD